ncbi:glycine betaine/L-proline ABC transporter ATP-binding protein [Rhizobium sp. AQ_MP]|uniref:quaternary amine ABC transporter ATP-binding protein n=1 Tax=Rhizobium sp. AQ_MP TaxID=2761536 RepID=UPI001AEE384D|nr:ATP-binding cassette domain-containing protein [Rhizobium sp. AQ_MP]
MMSDRAETATVTVPMLEASGVWKVFGSRAARACALAEQPQREAIAREAGVVALEDASFTVQRGEIFVIMGLSGSGKSTLLRCLTGLYDCTRGSVSIEGTNLTRLMRPQLVELRRRKISMVFQNFALLPHLNALDNVAFPLRVRGVAPAVRAEQASQALHLVGLGQKQRSFPHELSGGQQQRIGIARSLVTDPDIWFLDEPFSALDPLIRREMQDEFQRLQGQLHKTIVFVTHDLDEAIRLGDRIAIMADGKILQVGSPEQLVLNPADDYVKRFVSGLPREKVLRLGSMLEPLQQAISTPVLKVSDLLSDVLPIIVQADQPLTVADGAGLPVGQISRKGLASWLA